MAETILVYGAYGYTGALISWECAAMGLRPTLAGRDQTKLAPLAAEVKKIAEGHLAEIEKKIADLTSMRDTLSHLVHFCHGDDRPDCPILADLGGSEKA